MIAAQSFSWQLSTGSSYLGGSSWFWHYSRPRLSPALALLASTALTPAVCLPSAAPALSVFQEPCCGIKPFCLTSLSQILQGRSLACGTACLALSAQPLLVPLKCVISHRNRDLLTLWAIWLITFSLWDWIYAFLSSSFFWVSVRPFWILSKCSFMNFSFCDFCWATFDSKSSSAFYKTWFLIGLLSCMTRGLLSGIT